MQPAQSWRFPPFRLDAAPACLWQGDQLIALRPKPLAVLVHLVAHAGEVVSKAALLDAVWPETALGDDVLRSCIGQIRRALEDAAESPRLIATIHHSGYRFIAGDLGCDICDSTNRVVIVSFFVPYAGRHGRMKS